MKHSDLIKIVKDKANDALKELHADKGKKKLLTEEVSAIFNVLYKELGSLEEGDKVVIRGFGRFEKRRYKARVVTPPNKPKMLVKSTVKLIFKESSKTK